ncbi:hypothetical protein [uncultured Tenacibaculum sp.]|uniref:hypothetical protein n=1 Tax=uncultured Tenacibaculum sp. TaxID=174713 RepID=UPI002608A3D6|nr:hypothetical protein [uncultured Tenacibaculum sp.]
MKIKCNCGFYIVDNTDSLTNKGYLISDTQWFNFWDAIDNYEDIAFVYINGNKVKFKPAKNQSEYK